MADFPVGPDGLEIVTITAEAGTNPQQRESIANDPRAIIKLNGVRVDGWISWSAVENSFYEADTFHVEYAADALPSDHDASWFSEQTEVFVEIWATNKPSDPFDPQLSEMSRVIYGRVDNIEYDPVGILELTGRDLTAVFIDNKVAEEYPNKTSSQIATLLAQSHGLTPVVTATAIKVGVYYAHEQVRFVATRSEWDVLAWLAREEGFVVYVRGTELHFEPDPVATRTPYVISWVPGIESDPSPQVNVTELRFARPMTVAKGITVTVKSTSLTRKEPVVQSYPSNPRAIQAGKASPFGNVQTFYFMITAGKTPAQVEAYAKQRYDEIVSHAMMMSARLPADDALSIDLPIKVQGTGTAFDQVYYPRSITREMSLDGGYEMTVEAKNTSPNLQPET